VQKTGTTACISARYANTPALSLDIFVASELHCPIEATVGGGITLSKTSLRTCKLSDWTLVNLLPNKLKFKTRRPMEIVTVRTNKQKKMAAVTYPHLRVPAGGSEHLPGTMTFGKESIAVFC